MAKVSTDPEFQVMAIGYDLTIYTAADTRTALHAALLAHPHLRLDLSDVAEIDTAGFQLLLAASRHATASGGVLQIAAAAECVRELLHFYGAQDLLAA